MAIWPPARPQLLREYTRASDFHRHAAHLAGSGWHPIVVTAHQPPLALRALNALSLGVVALLGGLEPVLHVTYSTWRPAAAAAL